MDLIPGINVGNAIKQVGSYVGLAPRGDYDILDTLSVQGGDRDPVNGAFIGPQYASPTVGGDGPTQADPVDGYNATSNFNGSGSGTNWTAADEGAFYDDQISALSRLLGLTRTQFDTGLGNIGMQRTRLGDQKAKTMQGYDDQALENNQDKQRGVESVDSFANNSFNNLRRLLQGAGAGSSSVARELVPQLVSKSAGTRRMGVFDTAGRNARDIDVARGDAEDQYRFAGEDIDSQEKSFREGILNKQNELEGNISELQIKKAMANGSGYEAAKAAAAGTQSSIDGRMAELNSLFGQFNPTYRAVNTKKPELGKYTVDPAQINADQSIPAESRYYLPQIRKRQELV